LALKPALSVRQTQRLSLTPAMRQGLSVLQLTTLDLLSEIDRQVNENPLLLVGECRIRSAGPDIETATRYLVQPQSLADNLRQQIALMPLDPPIAQIAGYLTRDLTDDGYLASTATELAKTLNRPLAQIETAIAALQECEPTGVGARDLADCLTLQLVEKGIARDMAFGVCRHLDLLAEKQWGKAARATGVSRDVLKSMAGLIRTLSPRPAVGFAEPTRYSMPEVTVTRDGTGGFVTSLSHGTLPDVRVDAELLLQMAAVAGFTEKYRRPAEALIGALAFRDRTLLRVAVALVACQHRFFAIGPDQMRPLTRVELSEIVGLHPSTVGRALAGKALLFDGRVYPLDVFLPAALPTTSGGRVSAFSVQCSIRKLIEDEAEDATLSDDAIAALLNMQGVDIARRTVAKYRGCMKIPSSFARSRLKAARHARLTA